MKPKSTVGKREGAQAPAAPAAAQETRGKKLRSEFVDRTEENEGKAFIIVGVPLPPSSKRSKH